MKTVVLWVSLLLAVVVAQDEKPGGQDVDLDTLDLSKRLSDLEKSNARNKRLQEGIPELRHKLNETKKWLDKTNKNIHKLCAYTTSVHQEAKKAGRHISWDIKAQLFSLRRMSKSLKKLKRKLKEKEDKYSEDQIKAYMAKQWTKFQEEAANNINHGEEPQEKTTQDTISDEEIEKFMAGQWNKFKEEVADNIKHGEKPQEKTTQRPHEAAKGGEETKTFGSRVGSWFSSKRKAASRWVSNKFGAMKNWWKNKLHGPQHNTDKTTKAVEHDLARETSHPESEKDDMTVDHAPKSENRHRTSDPAQKVETREMTEDVVSKTELTPNPASKSETSDMTADPDQKAETTDVAADLPSKTETELTPNPASKSETGDMTFYPTPKEETSDKAADSAQKAETSDMTADPAQRAETSDMTADPAPKTKTKELTPNPAPKPPTADQNNEPDQESETPAQEEAAATPDQVKLFVSHELKSGRPDLVIEKTDKPTDGSTPEELHSIAQDPNKMNNEASAEDQNKSLED
ncbi:enolase-phosphatase E1-like [Haliotis asinina]|uniref:enolase-phosphatase E1-like n=1 Tax=Haliotis asinina TaxID=109174 RepID=UPI003531ACE5